MALEWTETCRPANSKIYKDITLLCLMVYCTLIFLETECVYCAVRAEYLHLVLLITYVSRDPQTASKYSHLKKSQLSHSVSKDERHTTKTFR